MCWAVVQRKAGVWSILCSNQSRHEYYLHTSVQCHLSTRRCWAAGGDWIQQWDCGNNCQGRTGWHLPLAEGIILYLVLRCSVYNLISYICLKKRRRKLPFLKNSNSNSLKLYLEISTDKLTNTCKYLTLENTFLLTVLLKWSAKTFSRTYCHHLVRAGAVRFNLTFT